MKKITQKQINRLKNIGFKVYKNHFIAYKTFCECYDAPPKWVIKENNIIIEKVNINIHKKCGYGINMGTLKWIKKNTDNEIWKVKVFFDYDTEIVIPVYSTGKIRVNKCQLIKIIRR